MSVQSVTTTPSREQATKKPPLKLHASTQGQCMVEDVWRRLHAVQKIKPRVKIDYAQYSSRIPDGADPFVSTAYALRKTLSRVAPFPAYPSVVRQSWNGLLAFESDARHAEIAIQDANGDVRGVRFSRALAEVLNQDLDFLDAALQAQQEQQKDCRYIYTQCFRKYCEELDAFLQAGDYDIDGQASYPMALIGSTAKEAVCDLTDIESQLQVNFVALQQSTALVGREIALLSNPQQTLTFTALNQRAADQLVIRPNGQFSQRQCIVINRVRAFYQAQIEFLDANRIYCREALGATQQLKEMYRVGAEIFC